MWIFIYGKISCGYNFILSFKQISIVLAKVMTDTLHLFYIIIVYVLMSAGPMWATGFLRR
jgi:hypothetical protein